MTYDPNIPNIPSSPSTSASPSQVNFAQFAAIFSNATGGVVYGHQPLNDSNQGKHGVVLMENQAADPGVTGDYSVLYNRNASSASGSQPQLFAQIPTFLPTIQDPKVAENLGMQLTYNSVGIIAPYYSFLPGGYLLYFGTTSNISVPIVLAPIPTEILCVQAYATATGMVTIPTGVPQTDVPFDAYVTVTQPKTILIGSTRATPGSTFFYLAIAKA